MLKHPHYKRTKFACFFTYFAMASVFVLPPLLFVTFRETYGISYTLLGTLVLINFCTQMIVDLVFTFFSKHFNIKKTVTAMPLLTSLGLLVYATVPVMCPKYAYAGLIVGTVIFSVSAGLSEVLVSPIVAALPSDNPKKDMSLLHSIYAYSVVTVVIISTVFLKVFSSDKWMYLTLFWAIVPIASFCFYFTSPIPDISVSQTTEGRPTSKKGTILALCTLCIFLGSASENTMTNWVSGYAEKALAFPKIWGDIAGMMLFAIFLGLGRVLYANYGKRIINALIAGMLGAAVCYTVAGLCTNAYISLVACILTGFFTSMLWPGTLIMMEELSPGCGVGAYALMAAGGDLGGSVAPQLMGFIVDKVSQSSFAIGFSSKLPFTTEQIGMRAGMLATIIFPIAGLLVVLLIKKRFFQNHHNIKL